MKLQFFGASKNVTGSSYILENTNSRVLIDCGLYQERDYLNRNWDPFPYAPKSLHAVTLTHGHLDHCGLLPKLYKEGFRGTIFGTKATLEIAELIMLDSARIQEEDANYKIKRHKREGRTTKHTPKPLYTESDVKKTIKLFKSVPFDKKVKITKDFKATFIQTGHIFGSAAVHFINEKNPKTSIIFSGDVGRRHKPIIQDPSPLIDADYLVCESTYGNKKHIKSNIEEDLIQIINDTFSKDGKIIIPSFAIERTQELLFYIFEALQQKKITSAPIFVDSPMAHKAVKIFENNKNLYDKEMQKHLSEGNNPFDFKELQFTSRRDESKKINDYTGKCIIIAGSGMCTGGRIKHHLSRHIEKEENCILFVGYQAKNTLGRHILEGEKMVRILGVEKEVKAKICRLNGLSAHADQQELIQWMATIPHAPKKVFITHGEESGSLALEEVIQQQLGWQTCIPNYQEEFELS